MQIVTFSFTITLQIYTYIFLFRDILNGRVLTDYNRRKSTNAYKIADVDQETLFSHMKKRQLTVI